MRILQVIPYYTPRRGGSVMALHTLIKNLKGHEHKVTVLTTDFEYDADFGKSIPGVDVIQFQCRARVGLFLYSPSMSKWLKKNINNYDLVHVHEFRSYQNILVRRHCRNSKKPYMLQAHGSLPSELGKGLSKKMFDAVWGNKIIRDAACFASVSNKEAEQYIEIGGSHLRMVTIPNIVQQRDARFPAGHFRSQLGIGDRKLILFLGRVNRLKGLPFLINSFAKMMETRKEVVLVIAGPDPEGLGKKLQDEVRKLGLVHSVLFIESVDDVGSAYIDAEVLVYPSSYEIFGLVPFEALLLGIPVIVTSSTSCGEIIKEQGCGLVVEYGDEKALAEAMDHALSHPKEMREMAAKGAEYVRTSLDGDSIVGRFEQAYANCLRNR